MDEEARPSPRQKHLWWARSMLLRVTVTTVVLGMLALIVLGTYISQEIRDGLLEKRLDGIMAETVRDVDAARKTIEASTAETPGDLQQLIEDIQSSLAISGGESRSLVLLQAPTNSSAVFLNTGSSDPRLVQIISPDLRSAVAEGNTPRWQHAALPGSAEPAVVVGSKLALRAAGEYELYLVYSLKSEQDTLALIQRVLAFGGSGLGLLVLGMTWVVTLQAVRPVRQAARVAARLTEGDLHERMTVKGHDEMATLASTFNEMASSLQRQFTRMEELSRLQRRFVADVSHELRTPFTTIRVASEVLVDAKENFPPEIKRSAELLWNQIVRFEELLADLLEISRIDAGAAQLDFELQDLAALVGDEMAAILPAAREYQVEMRFWAMAGEHLAIFDRIYISRILRNLFANAIEHANGKPIDVAVASTAKTIAVVVRDYGVGLTESQREHVFDRFWRADRSRTRTMGGTGLGLSIARENALLHGGSLEVWGEAGQGASFRLMLPKSARGMGVRPPLPLDMAAADFAVLERRELSERFAE